MKVTVARVLTSLLIALPLCTAIAAPIAWIFVSRTMRRCGYDLFGHGPQARLCTVAEVCAWWPSFYAWLIALLFVLFAVVFVMAWRERSEVPDDPVGSAKIPRG